MIYQLTLQPSPGQIREMLTIEFESLINIRPRLGNRSMIIQSETIRQQVESVTRNILGGVS